MVCVEGGWGAAGSEVGGRRTRIKMQPRDQKDSLKGLSLRQFSHAPHHTSLIDDKLNTRFLSLELSCLQNVYKPSDKLK